MSIQISDRMPRLCLSTTFFSWLLVFSASISPVVGVQEERFSTRNWQVEQGLPDNFINQVAQDKLGYLWVGTAAGLARFDSVNFKEYRDPAISSDFGFNIRDMALAPDGAVLTLPASGGVMEWRDEKSAVHPITGVLEGATPLDLFVEPGGAVWVGAEPATLIRWEKGVVHRFGRSDGVARRVNRMTFAVDGHGRTWVAAGEFLGWYQEGRLVPLNQPMSEIGSAILVAPARSGGLWVSSVEHLLRLENEHAVPVCEAPLWPSKRAGVQCMFEDSRGRLWIGTRREGLFVFARGELKKVALDARLILSVMEDVEGNIWIGTAGEGLCRLRTLNLTILNMEAGLAVDTSSSVCEDATGAVWCANRSGGLVRYKDEVIQRFGAVASGWIFASRVAPDDKNNIWLASTVGLYRFDVSRPDQLEPMNASMRGIHFLHGARDGKMWTASNLGLGFFRDGVYQSVGSRQESLPLRYDALAESKQGQIWVATSETQEAKHQIRIHEYVNDDLRERMAPGQWNYGPIHTLFFDHNDSLWIAAAGGLVLKQGDRLTHFSAAQGLPDDLVAQIEEDDAGYLWMAGRRSVFRVKIADLQAVADGKSSHVAVAVFGEDDGLHSAAAPGGGQPRSWRGHDGRLWFTLHKGVVGIDPAAIVAPRVSPPLYVEECMLDQQTLSVTKGRLEIPPGAQQLKIRLAVLEFAHPEHVALRYMLEGFDHEWSEVDRDRTIRYARLPPGDYRLLVQASNQSGV